MRNRLKNENHLANENSNTIIPPIIILREKFLQFDWLRSVVFQLNLKYLHVKITNLSNFTRLTAREITYNNFEITRVVFMSNITANPAITYTNLSHFRIVRKMLSTHSEVTEVE